MLERTAALKRSSKKDYYIDRIDFELAYAARLSQLRGGVFDEVIRETEAFVDEAAKEHDGIVTPDIVARAEEMLSPSRPRRRNTRSSARGTPTST